MQNCEVRLDQMVLRLLRDIHPRFPATRVTFSELPVVDADPVLVHELLAQVIANAFWYSALSPQPMVEISLDATGALQVIDNGPGAPRRVTILLEE